MERSAKPPFDLATASTNVGRTIKGSTADAADVGPRRSRCKACPREPARRLGHVLDPAWDGLEAVRRLQESAYRQVCRATQVLTGRSRNASSSSPAHPLDPRPHLRHDDRPV
jgi:hypothetical protein